MSRGVLLQHYTPNWKELIDISRPIHEEYCSKHGYELIIEEVPYFDRYDGIDKLSMYRHLEEGDVGVFMDADCMITNLSIKIEPLLWVKRDLYFSHGLNCGVFLARKTKLNDDVFNHLISSIRSGVFHCEQDAFEDMIIDRQEDHHFVVCNHPCFNSYIPELYGHIEQPKNITENEGRWVEGKSFILHLPALGMGKRIEIMKSIKITK